MKAILNHQVIDREKILLTVENRGFNYGDGFFETVSIISGTPRFLAQHLARLKKAAELMQMQTSDLLEETVVAREVENLRELNGNTEFAKLKIYMWREAAGLYAPQSNDTSVLLTIIPSTNQVSSIVAAAGFSEKTVNFPSQLSPFKTLSALKYVLAGIEKEEKKLDEIILLDHRGYVSEALYSNIFWKKDGVYCTPPLDTGCIDGIMKNWLLSAMNGNGMRAAESLVDKEQLLSAQNIFTTNASGVRHIKQIDGAKFEVDQEVDNLVSSIS